MTECVRIGATKHLIPIYNRLKKESVLLKELEMDINLSVSRDGYYSLLDYEICDEKDFEIISDNRISLCRHHIAEAVAEAIIDCWQPEMVRSIVESTYSDLSAMDTDRIIHKLFKPSNDQSIYLQTITSNLGWKKEITSRVVEFLETGNEIIIDGFIQFRLQDFKDELEQMANDAVDEFLLEKEYDDFIDLLRYFVDTQEPRLKKVHVVLFPSGIFNMYDNNYTIIDNDYLEGFILDLMDNDLSYEDLLVSALITIAPLEIVLHLPDSIGDMSSAVSTIQSVFGTRVTMCIGCSKCLNLQVKKF